MKVTLENGYECVIDDEVLDDWELVENLRAVDKGNVELMVDIVPQILGDEQAKALKEKLRKDNGKVSLKDMTKAITDIFTAVAKGKKS